MEGEIPKKSLDRVRARSTSHPISTAVMRLLGQSDNLPHVAGAASGKVPGMDIAHNIDMKVAAVTLSLPEPRCRDSTRRVHGTPRGNGTNNRFAQAPLKCCCWAELAECGDPWNWLSGLRALSPILGAGLLLVTMPKPEVIPRLPDLA
ncbi:intraflagellar transport protein 46-like protein [Platysternon megacephalum]|uniref:Intraflagellar transport protein 46-like protein n=1 Tax=Platysternon megacephalum TaxID=55544 RepID=A0A4D9E1D6_9SAUR|nr:intraflagellar transport protein 46-like protein [Platysternon megacephalum]